MPVGTSGWWGNDMKWSMLGLRRWRWWSHETQVGFRVLVESPFSTIGLKTFSCLLWRHAVDQTGTRRDAVDEAGTRRDAVDEAGTCRDAVDEAGTRHDAVDEAGTTRCGRRGWYPSRCGRRGWYLSWCGRPGWYPSHFLFLFKYLHVVSYLNLCFWLPIRNIH